MADATPRLREHPSVRFAQDEQVFDLDAAAERLLQEPEGPQHRGHHEMALFRHGPMTVGLFCFRAGASIPDHVLNGDTTIHVLDGELTVRAKETHTLGPNTIMTLKPNVTHDIKAERDTRALISFCLQS